MNIATFALIVAILANAFANILLKCANMLAEGATSPLAVYLSPWFLAGMTLFGINMLFYTRALKTMPLAIAYPRLVGGSLLVVTLAAYFWLKEPISPVQFAGMALIMLGIILVS